MNCSGTNVSSPNSSAKKKMKQLRLPFAPVNKMTPLSGGEDDVASSVSSATPSSPLPSSSSEKKRKRSEERFQPNKQPKPEPLSENIPATSDVDKSDKESDVEEVNPPKCVKRISVSVSVDDRSDTIILETPSMKNKTGNGSEACSPAVLEDRKTKIRVEIAKLTVKINELKDEMDAAVIKQDFMRAQKAKEEAETLTEDKDRYQSLLDSNNVRSMNEALQNKRNSEGGRRLIGEVAGNDSPKIAKKMTPKQDKRREDREREKMAKLKRKEEERLEREKRKEEERLEREKRKEEERLEKERKWKKKEEEKQEKERKKEEERLEKERKREEERLEKLKVEESEKKKKERAAQSFASFFFVKKAAAPTASNDNVTVINAFNDFQIKRHMRLAPINRRSDFDSSRKVALDTLLRNDDASTNRVPNLYLDILKEKGGNYAAGKFGKTWPVDEDDDDDGPDDDENEVVVMTVSGEVDDEKEVKQKVKAKLLQFHDNQRPPYRGTWSKTSKSVGGRRPFARDTQFFDYDYDSDEDWEEEEGGESLSDDEDGKEEDEDVPVEDEDDDDGFFVGHGVLDKDEMRVDEDEGEYNEDLEIMKQKLKAQAFEEEYNRKKPQKLKPKVFGCLWIYEEEKNDNAVVLEQLTKILSPSCAISLAVPGGVINTALSQSLSSSSSSPISSSNSTNQANAETCDSSTPSSSRKVRAFPEEAMRDLIRLVHANSHNKIFLAKEFCTFWERQRKVSDSASGTAGTPPPNSGVFSRRKTVDKIQEIAEYKKIPELKRKAWIVNEDILERYGRVEIPNSWSYILEQPNGSTPKAPVALLQSSSPNECLPSTSHASPQHHSCSTSLITKFTKVLTQEERQQQMLPRTPPSSELADKPPEKQKKRITLISVPKDPITISIDD